MNRQWLFLAPCFLLPYLVLAPSSSAQELKGGWQKPADGWLYSYEANDGESHCDLLAGGAGPPCDLRLDGAWNPLPGSDQWDGSGLGDGVGSPGGMEIITLVGKGDGGGDASVLRIIDPGDPRDNGFPDPGNRKIYNAYDLAASGVDTQTSPFDTGVTLLFRFRQLAPAEIEPFDLTDPDADGPGYIPFNSLKSVLGVVSRSLFAVNLGFTVLNGKLVLNNVVSDVEPRVEIPLCDPTGFVSVWAVAVTEGAQIHLTLWTDGALLPAFDGLVTLGGDADNFPSGQQNNYLYLGLGATGQAGAFDVDYFCFLPGAVDPTGPAGGLHCPRGINCTSLFENQKSRVEIAWSNADSYDSNEISRDGTVIATLPGGAETYTDSTPPRGQRTYQLNSKKGAQQCGGACAGLSCTVSVTGVPIQCITDLTCGLDENGQFHIWRWTNNDTYTSLRMRILLQLGAITDDPGPYLIGEPCLDGGLVELVNDLIPPDTTSVNSAVFRENQVAPGGIIVIELTAAKLDEQCEPVMVECSRDSLCPAGLTCTLDGTNINAAWTAGGGLTALSIQLENRAPQDLDPTSSSATLDATGFVGTVTVKLTPVACVGDCNQISCQVDLTPKGKAFHRGDADGNGQLQLTDAVRILNVLFLGIGKIDCMDAADADNNGSLQLTDAVRILNVLFLGIGSIPDPFAPGPDFGSHPCGPDPGAAVDHIGCETYNSCG